MSVSLEPNASGGFGKLVSRAVKHAKKLVPSMNPIVKELATCNSEDDDDQQELHVSLSRPVYLRHHQREDFKKAVNAIASSKVPLAQFLRYFHRTQLLLIPCFSRFSASFATFASFTNDEKTRVFLAMEVGAGHSQVQKFLY